MAQYTLPITLTGLCTVEVAPNGRLTLVRVDEVSDVDVNLDYGFVASDLTGLAVGQSTIDRVEDALEGEDAAIMGAFARALAPFTGERTRVEAGW